MIPLFLWLITVDWLMHSVQNVNKAGFELKKWNNFDDKASGHLVIRSALSFSLSVKSTHEILNSFIWKTYQVVFAYFCCCWFLQTLYLLIKLIQHYVLSVKIAICLMAWDVSHHGYDCGSYSDYEWAFPTKVVVKSVLIVFLGEIKIFSNINKLTIHTLVPAKLDPKWYQYMLWNFQFLWFIWSRQYKTSLTAPVPYFDVTDVLLRGTYRWYSNHLRILGSLLSSSPNLDPFFELQKETKFYCKTSPSKHSDILSETVDCERVVLLEMSV
jgi:hypothetical protein